MKKIALLIILTISITLILDAQRSILPIDSHNYKTSSIKVLNDDDKKLSINKNEEYQLDSMINYNWDAEIGEWVIGSRFEYYSLIYAKYFYSYDANGNQIMEKAYDIWDYETYELVESYRNESVYNNSGNLTLNIWYYLDQNKIIEYSYKYENIYDSDESIISKISYDWDVSSNDWIASSKENYNYDEQRKLISDINYGWDTDINDWIESSMNGYSYDTIGNQIIESSYYWDKNTNEWVGEKKWEAFYDENGNITSKIWYRWYSFTNDWLVSDMTEYSYDENGNQIMQTAFDWGGTADGWEFSSRDTSTYDNNGNYTSNTHYEWINTTNKWQESRKWEASYDKSGNITLEIWYDWNVTTQEWIKIEKWEASYDENENISSETWYYLNDTIPEFVEYGNRHLYGYDINENQTLEICHYWDDITQDWKLEYKKDMYYSVIGATEIESELSQNDFAIYPNPSDGYITIDLNQPQNSYIKVYDLQGKIVYQKLNQMGSSFTVDLSHITKGVYFFELSNNKNYRTEKLIIK